MEWTKEYPTNPGVYWVRNYRVTQWDEFEAGPSIAEIDSRMHCYFTASGDFFTQYEMVGGEWYGPIEPPGEQAREPEEECANCGCAFNAAEFEGILCPQCSEQSAYTRK